MRDRRGDRLDPTGFDTVGFSVVLLSAGPEPRAGAELVAHFTAAFGCGVSSIDADPLPLGDREQVVAALAHAEPIVEEGRAALWERDGVAKIVTPESGILVVERVAEPYWSDVRRVARALVDARFARAVEQHRSFAELGLVGLDAVDDPLRASRNLCRLAASLCTADVIGIAVPDRDLLAPPHEAVLDALRGDDPFAWPDVTADVEARRLEADDSRFERGVAEARGRWPLLVRAFGATDHGARAFSVKVAVDEGGVSENLWFWLERIDGAWIDCELESEPIYLRRIVRGDRRRFRADTLLDWVYTDEAGEQVGGFTL